MSMRLSRLKIDNYGPVRDRDWELQPGMNLFFGLNESGKTLVVESMVKLLLDGDTGDFDGIERVTGPPAGFLTVEHGEEVVQIPDASYADLFPEGTRAADLRNAFVIRDLDLRTPQRQGDFGHASYFRDVTDRMMGSQTRKIESVQDHVAEIGNLANTDSTRLMNRQPQKLKDRRELALELADDVEAYLEQCRDADILEIVREKREKEETLPAVETEIDALQRARKRQTLETGRKLVGELRAVEEAMDAHEGRAAEIETYRALRSDIDAFRRSDAADGADPALYRTALALTIPLLALSLIAAILSPVTGLGIVSGILLLVVLYTGYRLFQARSRVGEREQLVREANYAGIDGEDLPEVYATVEAAIQDFEAEASSLSTRRSETIGTLQGTFEVAHDSLDEWEAELDRFAQEIDDGERNFDAERLDELQARHRELQQSIRSLRDDLEDHRTQLSKFQRRVGEVNPEGHLDDVEDVRIESVEDLRRASELLDRFADQLDEQRTNAIAAIDIFDEIKAAEEREIDQLFAEDDFVVETFHEVTGGSYTDVRYDQSANTIRVERADERTFTPDELSQGTYDLLYLTVRLKLATRLLDGDAGFLVLDDAFVHSDARRTAREIDVLDQLATDGWQIVYFSFRDDVREAVRECETGHVTELERLPTRPSGGH